VPTDRAKSLPVRYQEPLAALLQFVGRALIPEQEIKTAQDAGCDTDHCNHERNSGHELSQVMRVSLPSLPFTQRIIAIIIQSVDFRKDDDQRASAGR
jgi:hypothetical protein